MAENSDPEPDAPCAVMKKPPHVRIQDPLLAAPVAPWPTAHQGATDRSDPTGRAERRCSQLDKGLEGQVGQVFRHVRWVS